MNLPTEQELQDKISEMLGSEFMGDKMPELDKKITGFIFDLKQFFGFNDGEPLDEDGIEFVVELIKYRLLESHAIFKGSD